MKTRMILAVSILVLAATAAVGRAAILAGPVTNAANGHIYFLLSSNTWTGAEAEAVSLGGHLATIRDSAENNWVVTNFIMFGGIPRPLWIGYHQRAGSVEPGGGWRWISGEATTYTGWTPPGEPNNNTLNGPQSWAMIWPPAAEGIIEPYLAGHWNDYWDSSRILDSSLTHLRWGLYGVVEIVPPVPRLSISRALPLVQLSWDSQTNRSYQIQYRSGISTHEWSDLGLPVSGNGTTNTITDAVVAPQRFYRVVPLP